jgi:hypothetical protein
MEVEIKLVFTVPQGTLINPNKTNSNFLFDII